MDSRQKVLEHVRCIGYFCNMREVDPGEDPEKIEGRIARCLGQDHWHDREGRIARLADKSQFPFVLLVLPSPRGPINTIAALAVLIACSRPRIQGRPGARLRRSKNGFRPLERSTESMSAACRQSARE
jgi:hypothetical protein